MARWMGKVAVLMAVVVVAFLSSCSTDLDVNAPYRRIPVVYAFLDPSTTTQFARVQRTFQNRGGDARTIAKEERDSSEYAAGEVTLKLFTLQGALLGTYQERESTDKDSSGAFYAPGHRVFALNLPSGTLQAGTSYKLELTRTSTGEVMATSVTPAVGPFNFQLPTNLPITDPRDSISLKTLFLNPEPGNEFRISFWPNCYSRLVGMSMRVKYQEADASGNVTNHDVWVNNAMRFFVPNAITACGRIGGPTSINLPSSLVFQALIDSVPVNNNVIRYFSGVDCHAYAASESITDFQNVNFQFQPITQSVPTYTNISNGIGLFGSVRSEVITAIFAPRLPTDMNELDAAGTPVYPSLHRLRFRTR